MKYHINPTTGRVTICKAVHSCPFGDMETEHFESKNAGQVAFEKSMVAKLFSDIVPKDALKDMDAHELAHGLLTLAEERGMNVERLKNAMDFAGFMHADQKRRNRGRHAITPYIEHPLRAAYRILRWGVTDEDVVIAAILHDTVEDGSLVFAAKICGIKNPSEGESRLLMLSFMKEEFGERAARFVKAVSNDVKVPGDAALSPEEKAIVYKTHLSNEVIGKPEVLAIKLADYLDNAGSLPHNDIPGAEARVKKQAFKYLPCVSLFQEEVNKSTSVLPSQALPKIQEQLERIKVNLTHITTKYANL